MTKNISLISLNQIFQNKIIFRLEYRDLFCILNFLGINEINKLNGYQLIKPKGFIMSVKVSLTVHYTSVLSHLEEGQLVFHHICKIVNETFIKKHVFSSNSFSNLFSYLSFLQSQQFVFYHKFHVFAYIII